MPACPHVDMLHPARRLWREDAPERESEWTPSDTRPIAKRRRLSARRRYRSRSRRRRSRLRDPVALLSLRAYGRRACACGRDGAQPARPAVAGDADGPCVAAPRGRPSGGADEQGSAGDGAPAERAGMRARRARRITCGRTSRGRDTTYQRRSVARLRRDLTARTSIHDAADGWRNILDLPRCPLAIYREASEALAVHHEHRLRDLQAARSFARRSLTVKSTPSRRHATQHRLARLDRKLGESGPVRQRRVLNPAKAATRNLPPATGTRSHKAASRSGR